MPRTAKALEDESPAEEYDIDLQEGVEDDAERHASDHIHFNTSFFGADYPVDTLVHRMNRGDFFVPEFQRSYVWTQKQASKFVESLLYGLPVPGIFLYREPNTGRHLIIDGQQRLKTLQFYFSGTFGERRFRLSEVARPWVGRTYEELQEQDKLRLGDAIIHATIFKQEEPKQNDQSICYVFQRINTGGIRLSGQEIRTCLY
jgi:uncharacterized protein with ParB-like and HNH nuclease domain